MEENGNTTDINATIRRWIDLYSDHLYSWAYHKTSSKETAEDLVQETFTAAVQSFAKFKGDSNPKTWLIAILNNKIYDYFRGKYRMQTVNENAVLENIFDPAANDQWKVSERPQEWPGETGNLLDDEDFRQALDECLHELPGNWHAAIQLKFVEEKKGEIICQELGITNTNFWQILHRAKLQLRKCLEFNWFKK